jgi:menaquinol-cytochrome c reductase cytochrome b/c subunit
VYGLGTVAVCLALGVLFAAPLRGLANPDLTPEPSKAPWYFVGLQELLSHFDPLVAGILIPGAAVLTFVLLPYVDRNPATEARNRKVAIAVFTIVGTIALALTIVGLVFRGPGWKLVNPFHHAYIEL